MISWVRDQLEGNQRFYRFVKECIFLINIIRNEAYCLNRKIFYSADIYKDSQSSQFFSNKNFPPFSSADDLVLILKKKSMQVEEGRNTFYLPPQPGIKDVLGELVDWYPENAGFKILKRFAKLERARYINNGTTYLIKVLMGGIKTQAIAQSCLYALGLGPKLFDVVQLTLGSIDLTVMVVEHCQGHLPSMESGEQFINILRKYKKQGFFQIVNPGGFISKDFTPPDCNNNLFIKSDKTFCYIDPQQFLFKKHLVRNEVLKQAKALPTSFNNCYQNVPRFTKAFKSKNDFHPDIILALLKKHAIDLTGKVVFDVWCNGGKKIALCLARGAMWGVGWDLPEIAAATEKILAVQGFTRFQAVGCHLSETLDLTADIPGWLSNHLSGSILFFKDAKENMEVPQSIGDINWDWLIYESYANNNEADYRGKLDRIKRDCRCIDLETLHYRDLAGTAYHLTIFKKSLNLQ